MAFTQIYRQPYSPIIMRDLFAECGIAQHEVAEVAGLNKETVRLMLNRGYRPVYKAAAIKRIESYLLGTVPNLRPSARNSGTVPLVWLRTRGLTFADLWKPSKDKTFHKFPANHGERLYFSRRNNLPAGLARLGRDQKLINIQKERRERIVENGFVTLATYDYRVNPFDQVRIRTGDGDILKRIFKMAIESNAMFSVVAPWGAGKTTAIEIASENVDAHIVKLISSDKEKIGIHDIERRLIRSLRPTEPIARDRNDRADQLRRIVGEAGNEKPVILIIEEAHCLHTTTLRALKRIREYEWRGRKNLFSIILIGQYDKLKTGNLEEIRLGIRSDTYKLKGLAPSEAILYIDETVGKKFEDEAVKAISELQIARNFLELQEALIILMSNALQNGSKRVSVYDVFSIYGGGIKQLMEKYDIKLSTLCEATGEDKTTLSLVINNKPHTLSSDKENKVRESINAAIKNLIPQIGVRRKEAM